MVINKELFKEYTNDIRKILIYMVNREEPMAFVCIDWLVNELNMDKSYVEDLIEYMYSDNLLKNSNTSCPSLTSAGLKIGQDIADNDVWDLAAKVCIENNIYSLQSVVFAIKNINQKRIIERIHTLKD